MTREEIVTEAGRRLGDTSTGFLTEVLNPTFNHVLLDLAQRECLGALKRKATFTIPQDTREFETREMVQLQPPHHPADFHRIVVWAWGPAEGLIARAPTDADFEAYRFAQGENARGKWQLWRLYPNTRTFQVQPPASEEVAGAEAEIVYTAPPDIIGWSDDVLEIQAEDLDTIVAGLQYHGASFGEETQARATEFLAVFEQKARRMWGRRWNGRPGRTRLYE